MKDFNKKIDDFLLMGKDYKIMADIANFLFDNKFEIVMKKVTLNNKELKDPTPITAYKIYSSSSHHEKIVNLAVQYCIDNNYRDIIYKHNRLVYNTTSFHLPEEKKL